MRHVASVLVARTALRVYQYGKSLLLGIILVGLAGCISVNVIPTELPLPVMPEIQFVSSEGTICLSEADADKLRKFLDQLNAFRAAWERLRAP